MRFKQLLNKFRPNVIRRNNIENQGVNGNDTEQNNENLSTLDAFCRMIEALFTCLFYALNSGDISMPTNQPSITNTESIDFKKFISPPSLNNMCQSVRQTAISSSLALKSKFRNFL